MKEHIFNLSIERMEQPDIDKAFSKFTSIGWVYNGKWDLGQSHTFAQFSWNKSETPIYPEGFVPNTKPDRIDLNKFPRPR